MNVAAATITTEEFDKAMRLACMNAAMRRVREEPFRGGDLTAVRYGALTAEIADEAGLSTSQTRRRLLSLYTEGKVLRDDVRGGTTAWWPVGLAPSPASAVPPAQAQNIVAGAKQAEAGFAALSDACRRPFTTPARQHWSDVLGVARDCSTSEARSAFIAAVAALDPADPEYPNQRQRVHAAIDACCREHEIQFDN